MKKGEIYLGYVERVDFPNKCVVIPIGENGSEVSAGNNPLKVGNPVSTVEYNSAEENNTVKNERVIIKNAIPGQTVRFRLTKKRSQKYEGMLTEVVSPAENELIPAACPHFGECGGCSYQNLSGGDELEMKRGQIERLLSPVIKGLSEGDISVEMIQSPVLEGYRNKMEFSFGDEYKNGPLALGMHKRGSFYDIVTVGQCRIVPPDMRLILLETLAYFGERGIPYLHKNDHRGYLRHLLVRRAVKTGDILIDLVTSGHLEKNGDDSKGFESDACEIKTGEMNHHSETEEKELLYNWRDTILSLERSGALTGHIAGILHTKNDSLADVVKDEGTELLYGEDHFMEELLGLKFKITPFSFFQTNSLGAELLYETVREFVSDGTEGSTGKVGRVLYDLYSGTGTIAQILSPVADKVIGVEIVEEAVRAAEENAAQNGLSNCSFICGDVLKTLDEIREKPDYIILDPPRDGIHPKALEKIISYGVENLVYISCKPTSLARDLESFYAGGYTVRKLKCVNMFPKTVHCETVCLLSNRKPD